MTDLRTRIAKVLARCQLYGPDWYDDNTWENPNPSQQVFLADADAVIKEIAAFRLEVSEDEFLDAVIAEDDGTCCAPLVSDNE